MRKRRWRQLPNEPVPLNCLPKPCRNSQMTFLKAPMKDKSALTCMPPIRQGTRCVHLVMADGTNSSLRDPEAVCPTTFYPTAHYPEPSPWFRPYSCSVTHLLRAGRAAPGRRRRSGREHVEVVAFALGRLIWTGAASVRKPASSRSAKQGLGDGTPLGEVLRGLPRPRDPPRRRRPSG